MFLFENFRKWIKDAQRKNKERLALIEPTFVIENPSFFPHIRFKLKTKMNEYLRQEQIISDNTKIYNEIERIQKIKHSYIPNRDKHIPIKKKEQLSNDKKSEILTKKNLKLAVRIQSIRGNYSKNDLAKEYKQHKMYVNRIQKFHKLNEINDDMNDLIQEDPLMAKNIIEKYAKILFRLAKKFVNPDSAFAATFVKCEKSICLMIGHTYEEIYNVNLYYTLRNSMDKIYLPLIRYWLDNEYRNDAIYIHKAIKSNNLPLLVEYLLNNEPSRTSHVKLVYLNYFKQSMKDSFEEYSKWDISINPIIFRLFK
ncbi:hypothetical protein A3Q56_07318, partial [Intoshia linei]